MKKLLPLGAKVKCISGIQVTRRIVAVARHYYTIKVHDGGPNGLTKRMHRDVILVEDTEEQYRQFIEKIQDRMG